MIGAETASCLTPLLPEHSHVVGVVDQVVTALMSLDMATVVVQASPLQQVQLMMQVQQAVGVAARVQTEAKCHGEKKDLVGS